MRMRNLPEQPNLVLCEHKQCRPGVCLLYLQTLEAVEACGEYLLCRPEHVPMESVGM